MCRDFICVHMFSKTLERFRRDGAHVCGSKGRVSLSQLSSGTTSHTFFADGHVNSASLVDKLSTPSRCVARKSPLTVVTFLP